MCYIFCRFGKDTNFQSKNNLYIRKPKCVTKAETVYKLTFGLIRDTACGGGGKGYTAALIGISIFIEPGLEIRHTMRCTNVWQLVLMQLWKNRNTFEAGVCYKKHIWEKWKNLSVTPPEAERGKLPLRKEVSKKLNVLFRTRGKDGLLLIPVVLKIKGPM